MNREVHVRICERLGVQFPGPTRPFENVAMVEMRTQLAIERAGLVTLHLQPARRSSIPTKTPADGRTDGPILNEWNGLVTLHLQPARRSSIPTKTPADGRTDGPIL